MRTLNLGILAHVDAGKTTLTERLLFTAGAIDRVGSVDAGTTQTDSLDLERERGITIRSAVASFLVGDLAVNLVDTPGHPDFIAEVERVLGVLDGAVLVVSAVEGVQPQTPLLFRALQRLHVPTLIFVNKIDRAGADDTRVIATLMRRLSSGMVPMGSVRDAGTPNAAFVPFADDDATNRAALTEILAEHDEAILRSFVGDEGSLTPTRLRAALAAQTRQGWVHPVFFGSAATGTGIDALLAGVDELLAGAERDPDAEVSGRVFKIERTPAGERVAYVRLFAGTLRPRQRVRVGGGEEAKPTSIKVFAPAGAPRRDTLAAGEMAAIRGLGAVRVGDAIGVPPPGQDETARFPRPALEAVVFPVKPDEAGQPPRGARPARRAGPAHRRPPGRAPARDRGLALRRGPEGGHRGDARARLRHRRGLPRDDRRVHRAPGGAGGGRGGHPLQDPHEHHGPQLTAEHEPVPGDPGAPDRARAASARASSSVRDVEPRLVPLYLFKTSEVFLTQLEAYVHEALEEGLAGWQVTDCRVTMTDCGYTSPETSAADFRRLTQLVLATALDRAGTWVCEPLADLALEMPSVTAPGRARRPRPARWPRDGPVLGQRRDEGVGACCRSRASARSSTSCPGLSMGEGILETRPGGYQPVGGDNPPRRERSAPSPARPRRLARLA